MEHGQRQLSTRELEVLTLLASGLSCTEIARKLGLSHKTVACHRSHIMEKLKAHEISVVVRYAIRNGLIVA
jgi:DNA-binding NarL/FixJ family response regulator